MIIAPPIITINGGVSFMNIHAHIGPRIASTSINIPTNSNQVACIFFIKPLMNLYSLVINQSLSLIFRGRDFYFNPQYFSMPA